MTATVDVLNLAEAPLAVPTGRAPSASNKPMPMCKVKSIKLNLLDSTGCASLLSAAVQSQTTELMALMCDWQLVAGAALAFWKS